MPMLVGRWMALAVPKEGQRRWASECSTLVAGGLLCEDEAAEDMSEAGIGLHRPWAVVQWSVPGLKAVAAIHHEIGGRVVGRAIQLQLCTQCEMGCDLVFQCPPERTPETRTRTARVHRNATVGRQPGTRQGLQECACLLYTSPSPRD